MSRDKSSDDSSPRSRPGRAARGGGQGRGHTDDRPAGKGDKSAPHPRPGSGKHGESKDPKAPHPRPGG